MIPNPSAFPLSSDNPADSSSGMTLRDYFAAAALTGLLANPAEDYSPLAENREKALIHQAWRLADFLLESR